MCGTQGIRLGACGRPACPSINVYNSRELHGGTVRLHHGSTHDTVREPHRWVVQGVTQLHDIHQHILPKRGTHKHIQQSTNHE